MGWKISTQEIESTEKILLPHGAHFQEDAKDVIRCWDSNDVAACPGSGKTTVLLAKLKLLANRMPLKTGAGICVLSHTNIAVNEIKSRLSECAGKILGYPNYVGTIQSFIDRFVTMPYMRMNVGKNMHPVDDATYAQHMLEMMKNKEYAILYNFIRKKLENSAQFNDCVDYIKKLSINDTGALSIGGSVLAGAKSSSAIQYNLLEKELVESEGIIRYRDAYLYACKAIKCLPKTYTNLFSARFQYIFIDEYQDCNGIQREVIDALFDATKCTVIKMGDPDQAIYNSLNDETSDWTPRTRSLSIATSSRYSQEIADVICKLKKENKSISTISKEIGIKPVLIVFDGENINRVLDVFINMLEKYKLYNKEGVYKAVGAIKRKESSGLKIGDYWSNFDSGVKNRNDDSYWSLIDDIVTYLNHGDLYKTELIIRKILYRIFHYAKLKSPTEDREYSLNMIKEFLDKQHRIFYRQWIYEMSINMPLNRGAVDCLMRQKINNILRLEKKQVGDFFDVLPQFFLRDDYATKKNMVEKNVFVEPRRGRRIEFNTIHGVKGETHDATLYLETEFRKSSDLKRILPYFGVGKPGKSDLYDYSRKLAYVGMSRPRKLLCVAMQAKTYDKGRAIFDDEWEVIDLRKGELVI